MMKDRIRQVRKDSGLNQTEFGAALGGATQAMITSYETGRVEPDGVMVALICQTFGVNRTWLETGEGDPYGGNMIPRLTRVLRTNPAMEQMLRSSLDLLTADDWRILNDMVARIVTRSKKE